MGSVFNLYLEIIYLIVCSFFDKSLDKSLDPFTCMVYLSTVKTVLTLWQESIKKKRSLKKRFITKQTIDDVMYTVEGMMIYLVKLCVECREADVLHWFFTSDSCEQLFALLRIKGCKGRRVQLDAASVVEGLNRANRSLELDADKEHLLDTDIAHTRCRSLIDCPLPTERIYKGKDMSLKSFKDAAEEEAKLGRRLQSW